MRTGLEARILGCSHPARPTRSPAWTPAAAGFFPATWLLGFHTPPDALERLTGLRFEAMFGAYAAILMPSALWLPLTALYLETPSTLLWIAIRGVLFAVGLSASLLAWMLLRRALHGPPLAWGAVLGFAFFWLQTMVLDAVVWPWFHHG